MSRRLLHRAWDATGRNGRDTLAEVVDAHGVDPHQAARHHKRYVSQSFCSVRLPALSEIRSEPATLVTLTPPMAVLSTSDKESSMFKPILFAVSIVAAGTMGFAVAHAASAASTKTPGYMYASCNQQGKLLSATSHATSCTKVRATVFDVTFDRSVQGCAIVASPGRPDGLETVLGQVSASNGKNSAQVVRVHSVVSQYTGDGHSFFVVVLC